MSNNGKPIIKIDDACNLGLTPRPSTPAEEADTLRRAEEIAGDESTWRPRCEVSTDLDKSRQNLDAALGECSEPRLFNKGGVLVAVAGHRAYNPTPPSLAMELAQRVAFLKVKQDEEGNEQTKPCLPPPALTTGMVAAPHMFGSVKPLRRLVTSPRILADGRITTLPGYYPCAQLYYTGKIRLGDLSMSLTEAVRVLEEPFADFPFVDASDKANALSVPLSLTCAELHKGGSPINVPVASRFGSGKTLLISAPVTLLTGSGPNTIDHETAGESLTKEITTAMIQSPPAILIDNVATTLDSARLAAIMTSEVTHARLLGGNQQAELHNTCFWAATGNAIQMTGEMIRRSYVTRIDANMEDPEERVNFKIPDLNSWVKDPANQSRYVTACLVIARAWVDAGSPRFTKQILGSFRDWCEVIGGMLEMIGHGQFLANKDHFKATADPEQEMWREIVSEWYRSFGSKQITTTDLLNVVTLIDPNGSDTDYANRRDQPLIHLGNGMMMAHSMRTKLGMLIRHKVGQVFRLVPDRGPQVEVKILNSARSQYQLLPIVPDRPLGAVPEKPEISSADLDLGWV